MTIFSPIMQIFKEYTKRLIEKVYKKLYSKLKEVFVNKNQLKKQILQKELQIKKMHLHKQDSICDSLVNSLILEKAILKKQLAELEKNVIKEKIKRFFCKHEKLICDYWKS